jgi:hypothetical protein
VLRVRGGACGRRQLLRQVLHEDGPRETVSDCHMRRSASSCDDLKCKVSTIFGCTYVQGQIEGLASYHFESETACFISYAAAPDHWTLDDGSRPPEQKHFSDVSYNPLTRTFTGKIDWSPRLFGGDQIWAYKLIFSDNFDIVCGGHIKATLANGMPRVMGI